MSEVTTPPVAPATAAKSTVAKPPVAAKSTVAKPAEAPQAYELLTHCGGFEKGVHVTAEQIVERNPTATAEDWLARKIIKPV